MNRFSLGALAVACAVSDLNAAELPRVSGPPPRFAIVAEVNQRDKSINLLETIVKIVPFEQVRKVEKNGMVVEEKFTAFKQELVQQILRVAITKETEVYDAGNNRLADAEIWKRLKTGVPILLSADGRKVDPAYLGIVKKDAIIVAIPQPPVTPRP